MSRHSSGFSRKNRATRSSVANVLYTPIPGMTYRAGTALLAVTPELVEGVDTSVSSLSSAGTAAR